MKKRKVLSSKNVAYPPPLWPTITLYLLLDKFNAPGWVWGAVGAVLLALWASAIVDICNRKKIELWKEEA